MGIDEVEVAFHSFSDSLPHINADVGRRGKAAYLLMSNATERERWAVVETPGDRWVTLEVTGGFALNHFEEDIDDEGLRSLISQYIEIGTAFLDLTEAESVPTGILFPVMTVATTSGSHKLSRSVARDIRELFRIRRQPEP